MTTVYLVRHGEVHNPEKVNYGRLPGFGLSPHGRRQAEATAAYLARQRRPLVFFSSPLQRARETAEILLAAQPQDTLAPLQLDERLQEAAARREGLPRRFAAGPYLSRAFAHVSQRQPLPQHESARVILQRMRTAVSTALRQGGEADVVMVSHQRPIGLLRVAFERGFDTPRAPLLLGIAPGLYLNHRCAPASVTGIEMRGEAVVAVTYWKPIPEATAA